MQARKPVWKTSSYLVYAGGLTVLVAGLAALGYLSGHYGHGALTAWALLILAVLWVIADSLRLRDRWTAAGIFAFASVIAWAAFLVLAWQWFGWVKHWNSAFGGWSVAHLSLELLILAAAVNDRRRWAFPLISLVSAVVGWFFVTDFFSNGGGWMYVVTLLVGLAYLVRWGSSDDPSAFWFHFVAGLLIGVALLHWLHSSDFDWALISAASLAYVAIANATKRSSWAVYGSIGFLGATLHYLFSTAGSRTIDGVPFGVPSISGWAPSVALACLGFWYVLLGLAVRRRIP
ncbi:MAG TPA: hypothetical protein VF091_00900 [Gaiellaceae bacterium]